MSVSTLSLHPLRSLLPVVFLASWALSAGWLNAQSGVIEIDLLEAETEEPLTGRVQILDAQGRPQRARGAFFEGGWNLVESPMVYRGRPGDYTYRVFHGPEFATGSGGFTLDKKSQAYDVLRLPRYANLADEGWVAGDLASHRSVASTGRWAPVEGIALAVCLSAGPRSDLQPGTTEQPWVEDGSFLDGRPGSGLALHHWVPPAEVPADVPSSRLLVMAKQATPRAQALPVHVEITRLWARDTPIWLASNQVDSIQLLGEHLVAEGPTPEFQPVVDPQPGRFRGALRPGRLTEYLYWQVLEAGLRIPPTAGSHCGKNKSPLGYNRVVASVASAGRQAWWQAVRAGRVFVTNGPLLRARVNGETPGAVFRAAKGESIDLDVTLTLTVADPVDYLDVIYNGESLYQARLDEYAQAGGRIPTLTVDRSGWLVLRVITGKSESYRMATTAPFYVELGDEPRVSQSAVRFFQQWLEQSARQLEEAPESAASQPFLAAARDFWARRLELANCP